MRAYSNNNLYKSAQASLCETHNHSTTFETTYKLACRSFSNALLPISFPLVQSSLLGGHELPVHFYPLERKPSRQTSRCNLLRSVRNCEADLSDNQSNIEKERELTEATAGLYQSTTLGKQYSSAPLNYYSLICTKSKTSGSHHDRLQTQLTHL